MKSLMNLYNALRRHCSLVAVVIVVFLTVGFQESCPPPNQTPPPEGTFDPRFYEGGAGVRGQIWALAKDPRTGMVFVGGQFTAGAGGSAHNIAIYNPSENSLQPLVNGGLDGIVQTVAVSGNYLYAGGYFNHSYDQDVDDLNHIARYKIIPDTQDPDEQRWFPLAEQGLDTPVTALAIAGDKLLVGGGSGAGESEGHVMHGFAIYENINNPSGGNWRSVAGGGLTGFVNSIAVNGNDIYVGGGFSRPFVGATPLMNRIGRYSFAAGPNPDSWHSLRNQSSDTGLDSTVNALAVNGDYLYVGGMFTHAVGSVPSITLNHIGRYNMEAADFQTAWSELTEHGLDGTVKAITISSDKMYIGGFFTGTTDGTTPNLTHIAGYDLATNTWNGFDGNGLDGDRMFVENGVWAIEVSDNFLYAGGQFSNTVDLTRTGLNNLAAYSLALPTRPTLANGTTESRSTPAGTGGWSTPGFHNGQALNNVIASLAADAAGKIYACGSFTGTSDGSVTGMNFIGRYDPVTSTWSPLANGGLNGSVSSVAIVGNFLYVGGSFTRTADLTIPNLNRIARYDLTTESWSPMPGNGLNGSGVSGVAASGTNVFVTGEFSRTFNSSVLNLNRVARFDTTANTWSAVADNGLNGTVQSLAVSGNDMFVGGFFSQTFGGATTGLNFVARYNIGSNTWSPLTGNGLNDSAKLSIFGDSLYMRGNFTQTNNGSIALNKRAHYNTATNTWSAIGGAQSDLDRAILTNVILRVGNELYLAGSFYDMGDAPAQYMTRIYLQQWKVPAGTTNWFDAANWATGAAPSANSNAVIPTGAGTVTIAADDVTMHDLNLSGGTLNIATGRTLTINGILWLNGGSITGGGTVNVTNCLQDGIMGGDRFTYIQTTLVRCVNASDPFVFPVGTANGYSPVIVRDVIGSGNVSVKANQGAYSNPASGLPVNRLARWWQIENPGAGVTSSNVIFGYEDADITGVESGYRAYRISGGSASQISSTVNVYSNRVTATGVTGFSDWTLAQGVSTAADVSLCGRVLTSEGRGITNAVITITDQSGNQRTAITGRFGNFRFEVLTAGETYVLSVRSRRFSFESPTQIVQLLDNIDDANFIASPPSGKTEKAARVKFDRFQPGR